MFSAVRSKGLTILNSGFGIRIEGFGMRHSDLEFGVLGNRFRIPGFGRTSACSDMRSANSRRNASTSSFFICSSRSGFRVSGFGFRFQILALGSQIYRVWGLQSGV